MTCHDIGYGPFNENQRAVKGAFLVSLGIDLENIPIELFEPCHFLDNGNLRLSNEYEARVNIWEIVGTTHSLYSNDSWLDVYIKEHKGQEHILRGNVTKEKYFRMLKNIKKNRIHVLNLLD